MIDSLNIRRIINTFFPCLQGIKMRRTKREGQKTDVCSDKKKIQQSEKKNHCSLKKKNFNFNLKINC